MSYQFYYFLDLNTLEQWVKATALAKAGEKARGLAMVKDKVEAHNGRMAFVQVVTLVPSVSVHSQKVEG